MAIEPEPNLILNGGGLRDSLDDVNHILNMIKSKNLAILYDISHVNIISHGDPVGFLKALRGRVSWVHVADNDFSLSPFGTGKRHRIRQQRRVVAASGRAGPVPGDSWCRHRAIQFRDGSRQIIVWPPELASGQLQFPYAQSVDVNATVETQLKNFQRSQSECRVGDRITP